MTDVQLKRKSAKKIAGVQEKEALGDSELPGNQQRNKKLRLQLKRNRKIKRKAGLLLKKYPTGHMYVHIQ